jgi:CHAP domain
MNGLPGAFATRSFRRGCASCVVATLLVLGGLFPSSAVAAVVVPGTSWGGGSGVDVCYPSTAACPGVTNVGGIAGEVWQCVELAQRYWESRGWWSGVFPGVNVAFEIFTTFAPNNGLVRVPQGSITNVELGDLLVFNEGVPGGAGHVSVVDYVENGVVFVVEENASASGRASYSLANGSIGDNSNYVAANAGGANRVYGIVQHPGPRGGGSTPPADTDSDGVADTADVCRFTITVTPIWNYRFGGGVPAGTKPGNRSGARVLDHGRHWLSKRRVVISTGMALATSWRSTPMQTIKLGLGCSLEQALG